jgi:hypothetical protein
MLNSYVRADVRGQRLADVFAIPREHLHQADRVWVMDEEDTLDIRRVSVAWRGQDRVLIQEGLGEGERLVTTRLSAPVKGMKLRTLSEASESGSTPSGMETVEMDAPSLEIHSEAPGSASSPGKGEPLADTHE